MITEHYRNLDLAVAAICPEIAKRAQAAPRVRNNEALWWELSCCILSSQVPYDTAVAAAARISDSKLLTHQEATNSERKDGLEALLRLPFQIGSKPRHYRFAALRASQLSLCYTAISESHGSISGLLDRLHTAEAVRDWLIQNAPGLGPKQSSMFIRNIGLSYDMAIIDRHVLKYMSAMRISAKPIRTSPVLTSYLRNERALQDHANKLGVPVGVMDWAVWIVMRMAAEMNKESVKA